MVDLRIGSERRQLHFGGGFACVLAGTDARSAAARWIATSIVGPPPAGSGGSPSEPEEPVWRLQSPLLPLRAPAVLDRDLLQTLWRSDCERRLEELAASRASLLSEREEIRAALDRLRTQPPLSPVAAAGGTVVRSVEAEAELATFKASAQRFVRVQSLLATIDALAPEPSPAALELADAWDAHRTSPLGANPLGQPAAPASPRTEAEPPRKATPPAAPASSARDADPALSAQRAELEQLHRTVVRAESRLFRRGLMPRRRLVAKYNEARLREQAALAGAGADSYEEFLQASSAREHPDDSRSALDDSRRAPDQEIAAPVSEPDASEVDPSIEDEAAARTRELRGRARALLGYEPGDDVAGELRAHLAEPAALSERVRELAELLGDAGVADLDDVVGRARAFVATPPSVHIPQPPTWAMRVSQADVSLGEIQGLEEELGAKDELLEEVEVETAPLVVSRDSNLLRLGPDDIVCVIGAMFDAYRAGEVLEGHLPLVLDGVLDGLAADARDAAVLALADVDDIQVIVVTDDDRVTQRVSAAGGTIVKWPVTEEQRRGPGGGRRSSPRASDRHSS